VCVCVCVCARARECFVYERDRTIIRGHLLTTNICPWLGFKFMVIRATANIARV